MKILLVFFVLCTPFIMRSQTVDICSPAICHCTATSYNCEGRNITDLLGGFNNSATLLDLSNNKITSVKVGPLNNLNNLKSLYLEGNLIEIIEEGSFGGLMNLKKLLRKLIGNQETIIERVESTLYEIASIDVKITLTGNQLKSIRRDVFRNLPSLEELHLEVNLIETIEEGSFDGLMKLTNLFLQLNLLTEIRRDYFRHLPSIEKLDLSNNKITSINRYAFFTIPVTDGIILDNNPLNCSCEEYLLQEFFELRTDVLRLKQIICNTVQTPCSSGETLFTSPTSCYACQYAGSFSDCSNQAKTQCTEKNSVCYSQIEYSGGDLNISGGCEDVKSCLYDEENNRQTCLIGKETKCRFCNPDGLSNARDETNTTKQFYARLLIPLGTQMTALLQNTSSSPHKSFIMDLESELNKKIRGQLGRFDVQFHNWESAQVTFRVTCTTMWFINPTDVMNAIADSLQNRTISGINVNTVQIFLSGGDVPCQSETTEDPTYGKFTWPMTKPGALASIQCPYQLYNNRTVKNASRHCERQSDDSGQWKQPLVSSCPHADKNSRKIQTLAESDINEDNMEEVSSKLNKLTSNWQSFRSAQITWSVDIIYRISNLSRASPTSISATLDTVNRMLFIKFESLQQAEIESKSSKRLVKGIQMLFDGVSVADGDYKAVKENIAGIASAVGASSFKGLTLSYRNPGTKTLTDTKITYDRKDDGVIEEEHSGIVLPRIMFDMLSQEQRSSIDKITLLVFRDSKLFSSITQTNETKFIQDDDGDTIPAERKINSNIIGASVPATPVKDLKTPVVITLSHLHAGKNVSCVYWDDDSSTWSADGCYVKKTTDDYTVCHCYHLTNFALLMDVYSTGASNLALSIISYVGCGLSLIGVLLTLITYLKFRKLRRGNPSKILMNLCLSIGLVDIVFLLGVQEYSGKSDAGCKVVAILLHYFLLTSMCWMAVEAFYMYLALVKVFDTHVAHFQLKSSLFGWCTPLLVIAITLGINKSENYGLQPGGICWLDRIPFYAAFLTPVCLLLLVNTIIFLLVIRRILNRGTKKLTKSDKSSTIVRLRGAVTVVVLLGLTWVFGVLAFDGVGEAFHYMFALLNSSQGFFIFIFHCVLKKEAQQCWRQALPCLKSSYEKDTTSNTRKEGYSGSVDSSKTTALTLVSKSVSSTIDPSNTTKLDFISKESKSQNSNSVEDERKNNTERTDQVSNSVEDEGIIKTERTDQVSNSVGDEGIIKTESSSQVSDSVEEEGKNSTDKSKTNDPNESTKLNLNLKESTSQVSKSDEEERKNNTAFRGNWHVQVPAPKQKISFV